MWDSTLVAAGLRREAELLICCAAPAETAGRVEQIRRLSGEGLDWDYLLGLAEAHALTPLLYWRLKSHRPEAIPAQLAERFGSNTRNSVLLTGALLELLDLFEGEGIRALPYKGPTLAMAAYGNLALRKFLDLDLLIHREDALRARRLLMENGYYSELELRPRREKAYLKAYDEFGLIGPDGRPLVELHWAVTPYYFSVSLDIDQFWRRAGLVNLGRRVTPTLGDEDLLLALCLHATKHCWTRLSMVCDIAWLIAAGKVGWDELLERARRAGSLRMALLGTGLAAHFFEAPVPEKIARQIADDNAVQALLTKVAAELFDSGAREGAIARAGVFHMRARERWLDKARYFARLAATPGIEDWEFADLPAGLDFLYPLLRVPRLLRKYWMRVP